MKIQKQSKAIVFVTMTLLGMACTHSHSGVSDHETKHPGASTLSFDRATHEFKGQKIAIASQGEASSRAGLEIARLGGNAVDVAAAVSFMISVERPQSTGIGGGGFMILYNPTSGLSSAIDFREMAPAGASENMFLDPKTGELIKAKSTEGIHAGAVPGLVAGVLEAFEKHGSGKVTRAQILAPAIKLAREGFKVYDHLAKAIAAQKEVLTLYPSSKKIFLKEDGSPLKEGDLLIQEDLARTLEEISKKGKSGFYSGNVAQKILSQQKKLGGLITAKDLKDYQVKWRKPVTGTFNGYEIVSMPPPSSGGTHVIQILNGVENEGLSQKGPLAVESIHRTASAMQRAFADRAEFMGDTDFAPKPVPLGGLLSKKYMKSRLSGFDLKKATPSDGVGAPGVRFGDPFPYESSETTHFTVMDQSGFTVTSTQTINGWMGSGVVVDGAGFLINNEMDDFSTKAGSPNMFGAVGGKQNAVAPKKRPLSSMSPTLVLKDKKTFMALGSPSGTRIISCVALTLLNVLEYKMPLWDAVSALRYHHQWSPDEIRVEPPFFDTKTESALKNLGYKVNNSDLGCQVQAVMKVEDGLVSVSDRRGFGLATGE